MDPEVVLKLLEGHKDVLTPAAEEQERIYGRSCPRCGGACRRLASFHSMHTGQDPLPRFYLQCMACHEEFDPETGLTLKVGSIGLGVEPAIPIIKSAPE